MGQWLQEPQWVGNWKTDQIKEFLFIAQLTISQKWKQYKLSIFQKKYFQNPFLTFQINIISYMRKISFLSFILVRNWLKLKKNIKWCPNFRNQESHFDTSTERRPRRGRPQIASSLAPPPGHTRQIQIEQQQNGASIYNIDLFLIKLICFE